MRKTTESRKLSGFRLGFFVMIFQTNQLINCFSAPPKHDQLKKKEAETKQKEVIHVMTPKIMNSLKAELTKMAQAAENKKCQGELAGMS